MQPSANEQSFSKVFHEPENEQGFSKDFLDWLQGDNRLTLPRRKQSRVDSRQPIQVNSHTNGDVDMHTDTNATRCFRSGPVMAVKELQVNDFNFPALHSDQTAHGGAEWVVKKIKSGYFMNPVKVQNSKVTPF